MRLHYYHLNTLKSMIKYTNYDIVFQEIPNETTLAINLSNCPHKCSMCHSPELWQNIGTRLTITELSKIINLYKDNITCVCLMGGDNDEESILELMMYMSLNYTDLKTAWYSGNNKISNNVLDEIYFFDYIKIGPYIAEKGPLNSKHTNQRMYQVIESQLIDITNKFWD